MNLRPVDQTTFGWWRPPYQPGNCLSACLATILDLSIDDVPNFIDLSDTNDSQWRDRLNAWLAAMGLRAHHISFAPCPTEALAGFAPSSPFVLFGRSKKNFEHAVVAAGPRVVHDPHPSRSGLATAHGMIIIEPDC